MLRLRQAGCPALRTFVMRSLPAAPPAHPFHSRSSVHIIHVSRRELSYSRKRPSSSPMPQQPLPPDKPQPPASRPSRGVPPADLRGKIEFFQEWFIGAAFLLAVVLAVLGWAIDRVPETNRLRLMFYPRWVDQRLGLMAERYLMLQNKIVDSTHADDVKLLQEIADRLEKTPGGLKLRVSVSKDEAPNAFVLPNGRCVVTTSLLSILGRDPDMLAVVLAHESAHVRARHAAERMSNASVISFLLGGKSDASALLLELPFSRKQEDFIGILAASRACFTPQKAITVWERMMKLDSAQSGMLTLLSSHPSAKDRLQKLSLWMPAAEQERLAHCAHVDSLTKGK